MLTKPNQKTITSAALTAGAFVAGAKVGDGLAAVMPASTNGYKRYILAFAAIGIAASINAKTTATQGAQNALLGLGAKQLYDELTDTLTDAIQIKLQTTTAPLNSTDRFVNAIVGHSEKDSLIPAANLPGASNGAWLGSAWEGDNADDMWNRPLEEESVPALVSFTGI